LYRESLIYEDHPHYDFWLKAVLGGVLALTLIMGFVFLQVDAEGSVVMFGITIFDGLLFYFIIPRSYGIYTDLLVIHLGGPFSVKIRLSDIKTVRPASRISSYAYNGLRFATSSKNILEIIRRRGMNVVISPANLEMFLEQLNQAMKMDLSLVHSGKS
jgi:hypothetical protein